MGGSKNEGNKTTIFTFMFGLTYQIFCIISAGVFWLINIRNKKAVLPPINNLLLLESASSLALKIRTQKVTSEEVVRAFIDRINTVNPIINGVVDHRFDLALEEARQID